MKIAALFFALMPLAAAAFRPYVTLSVKPSSVVLTESAEAEISIVTRQQFRRNPSIAADFIAEGSRLQMERSEADVNGTNAWVYTVRVPVAGEDAGVRTLGPVRVSIPVRTDFFGFVSKTLDMESGTVALEVVAPPMKDRPDNYCGAIARDFSAVAALDANVCTAGDPLMFSLELTGATDMSMVRPSALEKFFADTPFKLDQASLRTETLAASKIFTWRVRAMKAGTVEFPPLEIAWFDAASRTYKICRTSAIPVQVKAGAQASLGAIDELGGETDEFPMPDGLDLDFEVRDFTLRHAVTLAVRARGDKEFLKAAEKYREFLDSPAGEKLPAGELAKHLSNLGSILVMAGKPREAVAAYSSAELKAGATPCTLRGMKSAYARIKNDPRADLPFPRIMFPFWFRWALLGRVAFSVGAAFAFVALFVLAVRAGRRLSVLAAMCAFICSAQAWPFGGRSPFEGFFDDMPMRMGGTEACPIKASAWFNTVSAAVGEPVELFVSVDPGPVRIEPGSLGLNVEFPEKSEHGDAVSGESPNLFKMPAVFLESGTNAVKLVLGGTYSGSYRITNGNHITSCRVMNQSFRIEINPEPVVVKPLPENGRHLDFTGAVGRKFQLSQKLIPEKVRPGDLVTAEYRLDYDGWFPSNTVPRIDNLSREFKAYGIKEVSRTPKSVVWQQVLVPRTVAATNSALVSLSCYNVRGRRYERVIAKPKKLVFISQEASSTENTSVLIAGSSNTPAASASGAKKLEPVRLRFAPSDSSPVVLVLPPDAEFQETGKRNGWRRLESARGAGWVK